MKVIYTENPSKAIDTVYRNPNVFYGVIAKATEVTVEGDYPNIVEAYNAMGIEVNQPTPNDRKSINPADMKVDQLKEALTAKGIEFPPKAVREELIKLLEESGGA